MIFTCTEMLSRECLLAFLPGPEAGWAQWTWLQVWSFMDYAVTAFIFWCVPMTWSCQTLLLHVCSRIIPSTQQVCRSGPDKFLWIILWKPQTIYHLLGRRAHSKCREREQSLNFQGRNTVFSLKFRLQGVVGGQCSWGCDSANEQSKFHFKYTKAAFPILHGLNSHLTIRMGAGRQSLAMVWCIPPFILTRLSGGGDWRMLLSVGRNLIF